MFHIEKGEHDQDGRPIVLRGSISQSFCPFSAGLFTSETAAENLTAISCRKFKRHNNSNAHASTAASLRSSSTSSSSESVSVSDSRPSSSSVMNNRNTPTNGGRLTISGLLNTRPLSANSRARAGRQGPQGSQRVYVAGMDRWGYDVDDDDDSEDSLEEYMDSTTLSHRASSRRSSSKHTQAASFSRPSTAPIRRSRFPPKHPSSSFSAQATAKVNAENTKQPHENHKLGLQNVKSGSRPMSATRGGSVPKSKKKKKHRPKSAGPNFMSLGKKKKNKTQHPPGGPQVRRLHSAKERKAAREGDLSHLAEVSAQLHARQRKPGYVSLQSVLSRRPTSAVTISAKRAHTGGIPRRFFVGDHARTRFRSVEQKANEAANLVQVYRLKARRPVELNMAYIMNMQAMNSRFNAALVKTPPRGMLFHPDMQEDAEVDQKVPDHSVAQANGRRWSDFYVYREQENQKGAREREKGSV